MEVKVHGALRISEAASLGIHAMTYLAAEKERKSAVRRMAESLRVSEAHLAKVMQRLNRVGLVSSVRGPGGGYRLGRPREEISLLDIVETIDGPLEQSSCIMPVKTCGGAGCVFGDLLEKVYVTVREYLGGTKLSELEGTYA
jgi:Rrf2 family protein